MFKLMFGFLLGCFVTYNFLITDEIYLSYLEQSNKLLLSTIDSLQDHLRNNVNTPKN